MTVQWDELRVAYEEWRSQRDKHDRWMSDIAAGKPYDKSALQRDLDELDALHKVFLQKALPFVRPKP
jgi:hypothetical protein